MYIYDNNSVRERLIQLRKETGWTREAFCEITGISKNTLVRYETGQVIPKLEIVGRIASATGYSVDWILGLSRQSRIIKPVDLDTSK